VKVIGTDTELLGLTVTDPGGAEHPVATASQLPESEYVAWELPLLETVKLAVPACPASNQ
jgi:hypothetical protein